MAAGKTMLVTKGATNVYVARQPKIKRSRYVKRSRYSKYSKKARQGNGRQIKLSNNFNGSAPFPNMKTVKLVYCDNIQLGTPALTTNLGTEQIYTLNSLYHPDGTNVGHQPFGFDQLQLLYTRYRVYGCKVQFRFTGPLDASMWYACNVGVSGIAGKAYGFASETDDVATGVIASDNGVKRSSFSQYFPIHKILGVSAIEYKVDDSYESAINASPSDIAVIRLAVGKLNSAIQTSMSCQVQVKLTFYAMVRLKAELAQSTV